MPVRSLVTGLSRASPSEQGGNDEQPASEATDDVDRARVTIGNGGGEGWDEGADC